MLGTYWIFNDAERSELCDWLVAQFPVLCLRFFHRGPSSVCKWPSCCESERRWHRNNCLHHGRRTPLRNRIHAAWTLSGISPGNLDFLSLALGQSTTEFPIFVCETVWSWVSLRGWTDWSDCGCCWGQRMVSDVYTVCTAMYNQYTGWSERK